MIPYEPDNIFARILAGDLPSHKVFEDADTLVIMDIMPQADGHALVIPKGARRNILDTDPAVVLAAMNCAQRVAKAAMTAFAADGVTVTQYNEAPAGQTVFHLHVHVIPRYEDRPLGAHGVMETDQEKLATQAKALATAMSNEFPG